MTSSRFHKGKVTSGQECNSYLIDWRTRETFYHSFAFFKDTFLRPIKILSPLSPLPQRQKRAIMAITTRIEGWSCKTWLPQTHITSCISYEQNTTPQTRTLTQTQHWQQGWHPRLSQWTWNHFLEMEGLKQSTSDLRYRKTGLPIPWLY